VAEGSGEGQTADAHSGTHDVFISYASHDTAVAENVATALEGQGLKCWIAPRDVTPGAHYASEIVHAIDSAKAIALILSQDAATSPHVLREIERATSKRHPVVTLRLDQAPLPAEFEYFLNTSQWLDASGGTAIRMMPKLVAAMKSAIKAPAATPSAALTSHAPARSASIRSRSRAAIVVASLIGLALAGFAVNSLWLSNRRAASTSAPMTVPAAPTIPEKSVAVLPFVDMSEKKDQEYFSDGLSEELIDKLAHSADLKVIARTSSFQFKGKNEDMRTIGQKLGVANLLEGSVRTSGKTLRVTAQLIKVSDGSHVWSETYDRDRGDIFKVQDEIATAVVAALQATMTKPKSSPDARRENIEAYNAILRGRYFRRKHTKQDSERAVASFEEAIRLDPNDAVAWMELAKTYNYRFGTGWMRPNEIYAKARSAIDRALAINPNLADAHLLLGALEWNYSFDIAAAQAQFSRARELDPNNSSAIGPLTGEGFVALGNGQSDQAVRIFRLLEERDPLDAVVLEDLTYAYFAGDRLPDAERTLRDLLALDPSFAGAHCFLGEVLLAENKPDEALAAMSEEPDEASRLTCLPDAMWKLGRRKEADALLVEAASKYSDSGAYTLAESYAMRNDKDQAFKWLDRAFENREAPVNVMMRWDPLLRNLHGDPRFTALLQKLKLPEQP
jgi:TolB-like protein/cytochrome c-type biogenesis protein CcmH/NrfG